MAVGAVVGAIYFFAISGWKKNPTPSFIGRRAAAWWGLISAELFFISLKAPGGKDLGLTADLIFGFSAWIIFGVSTSLLFGFAVFTVSLARRAKTQSK